MEDWLATLFLNKYGRYLRTQDLKDYINNSTHVLYFSFLVVVGDGDVGETDWPAVMVWLFSAWW